MQQLYRMVSNGADMYKAWNEMHKAGNTVGTLKNAKRGFSKWKAPEAAPAASGTTGVAVAPSATNSNTACPPKPVAESAVRTGDAIGLKNRRTTHQVGVDSPGPTSPDHTRLDHTTPHHTTPPHHLTTPHHTTPRHTTPHNITPHHLTAGRHGPPPPPPPPPQPSSSPPWWLQPWPPWLPQPQPWPPW